MSVVASNITKTFSVGEKPAVHGVTFAAPEGSITSLLGPSGSGKSTVLRIVAGLESPDSGTIRIGERDMTRVPPRERAIGLVFQNYALFDNMSVAENIAFGLKVRKASPTFVAHRVRELLELIQLAHLGDRYPAQLSGGQKQRVALARAVAPQPKVLLLDEPFGALDTRVRTELRQWLHRFHEQTNVTTILVTHDQEEALELSDHVVILRDGTIEQAGSAHELYDHPRTTFVAAFLGGASRVSSRFLPESMTAAASNADGARFTALVRPHDVRIRHDQSAGNSAMGLIRRIVRVGGYVKITLELDDASMLEAEIAYAESERLKLRPGERVGFDFAHASVFVEDYSI